ncbi:MAG: hypothetical protein COZ46_07250 [Verrucomicrobia bacterium CG_4_10_14_3_um_filter_43_23]|nr:MAG: hypothetical protein AUJ82_06560 [Verrucomicrobia bacterium CG1_02_43_26]PIP59790.1 MAG: hypothetical protein COX01_01910 [Verrucomicrobia bacterium CG22_combo_CG10-13_8_21_14_all_43_17]PIX57797.1 MAG: hypothetical protein COZ46_07250 [Verrucomicrobia bacterium CG_4_10_14_3_um_filter_43_23]PIY60895.1 MAG: hypothetical protein COY94_08245 [Verrucomicrobia bacterium CG_4_10_14_0_8_um_filter_43_34]PJA43500.1 MAG: hypothetical protein CO175_07630 [Verrucomicrobia bacterium CG_4_9_14_3_um_fi
MKAAELYTNIGTSIALLIIIGATLLIVAKIFSLHRLNNKLRVRRKRRLIKVINSLAVLVVLLILLGIWGIEAKEVWIFITSIIGLLGISLFAGWSLLSNIFGAYILFFASQLDIHDVIIVKDGDNTVKGEIIDMGLFFIRVRQVDGSIVNVPNNIALQRMVVLCEET